MSIRARVIEVFAVMGLVLSIGTEPGDAWVKKDWLPTSALTVITDVFCRSDNCFGPPGDRPSYGSGPFTQEEWQQAIRDAVAQWNGTGAYFQIETRRARTGEDPCTLPDSTVPILLADDGPSGNVCPGGFPIPSDAGAISFTTPPFPAARLYISTEHGGGLPHLRRLLVHELGHFIGLSHPNDFGQDVRAIMNGDLRCSLHGESFTYCDRVQPDDIAGIQALWGGGTPEVLVGSLENPRADSAQSGIGIISGWVCEAGQVEIDITTEDGRVLLYKAAYGTERGDTERVCGDTDNGFGLLFNWNLLGDGEHEVAVLVDGTVLGQATVQVTTLGQEFLRGAEGRYVLDGFPTPGNSVVIEWEQSLQNFVITSK